MLKFGNFLAMLAILIIISSSISGQGLRTNAVVNDIDVQNDSSLVHDCPLSTSAKSQNQYPYGDTSVYIYNDQGPVANTWFSICTMCTGGFEWGDPRYVKTDGNGIFTLTFYAVNDLNLLTLHGPNPPTEDDYNATCPISSDYFINTKPEELTYSCFYMGGPSFGCQFICGDANKDNEVTMDDVYTVAEYDVNLPVDIDLYASNVHRDGVVDIFDALKIAMYIDGQVTLECNFNCSCW
ncbi:MAG: hypothetical protein GY795_05570 [Desulfobacterales bacterium]|nr:hypothetical protein [Desulfobacterales bacterium]